MIDGRYRIVSTLGSGAMGVVHRAEDVFLERTVAVKVIDPSVANDPETVERFKKEARALAQIRHENVVQVYAFGPHERSFYFAMEFVEGQNLESIIATHTSRRDPFELERAIAIIRSIAGGLDAVHACGLVHRDVKPANIVIEAKTGRPVLVDFGLARRWSANPSRSSTAGTPAYMAPEQALDPDGTRTTSSADIYALAASAYELLTGLPVFDGHDVVEVLTKHMRSPPPPMSSIRAELGPLDGPMSRALAKEPAHRPQKASEFAAALEVEMRRAVSTVRARPRGVAERIVVLEIDESLRRQVIRVVTRALHGAGCDARIEAVGSASEAIDALQREPAGLVIIDDESSVASPEQLVAEIRQVATPGYTRIVVLTRQWYTLRPALAAAGVADVLPKPLNAQMLTQAVERLIARRSRLSG